MRYLVLLVLIFYTSFSSAQCTQSPIDFSNCNFTSIAHRGYSEFYPENTLIAVEEAFKRGIKYCEIDVSITSDGVYVLHHDPYTIARTTNGTGTISENSFDDLSLLDAGFWKSSYFKGTKVPTLVEALNLAQQYNAFLYLDIKGFDPVLLAKALADSNAEAHRMLPAITSMDRAIQFRLHCPSSSWIWFGANPEHIGDDTWYTEKIEQGCKYFELSSYEIFQDIGWFERFRDKVHENGAELWAYTVNNEEIIYSLMEMGIDGVETDRPYVAQLKSCGFYPTSLYPKKETTGNWNFDLQGMNSLGIGSLLKNYNTNKDSLQEIMFGTTSEMGISAINGQEAQIAKVPAYNPTNGLFVYDNFMMEDSGAVDYTYSLIMDIYIPSAYKGEYIALIQTSPDNLNDADFFISPDGQLGTFGDYHGDYEFDTWQRIIFVLNGNKVQKYLDGNYIGESIVSGSRWTAFNNMAYHGKHGVLLFADDSNETAEIYLSALQLRNYAIGVEEAGKLGTASVEGIPINRANLYSSGIENLEMELIDWEQQSIFIKFQKGVQTNTIKYHLQLSYGANSDIPPEGYFSFSEGEKSFDVTAEDGTTKTWTICMLTPTDADNIGAQNSLEYYPNPVKDIVTIKLNKKGKLFLYNLYGQCLIQEELFKGENSLNLSNLESGNYYFKVVTSTGSTQSGKLVKLH